MSVHGEITDIRIKDIREICRLSKLKKSTLKKMRDNWAYRGSELTKFQIIYQIVFLRDPPDDI